MNPVIDIQGLSKFFGKHKALDAIQLQVNPGDFYGFIGPNGAGKSTTIRILLGLLNKSSGTAKIFGQEVRPNQVDLLSRIGYMSSEAIVYPNMKVNEVIKFSAKLRGTYQPDQVKDLADKFDLDLSKKVKELSLGNRKKISIITALQHWPELYILDEPTSGLDPLMQQVFWQEIQDRNRSGATVFVSSHILTEVQKYCQQAAIIRQGKIISETSVESLMQNAAKEVHIYGLQTIDLDGIRQLQAFKDGISFTYEGSSQALIQALFNHQDQITDFSVSQPDIDQIFMHYYEKGETDDI